MIDTPTRRVVLGAGVFAAGSLFMVDGSVAQAPLAPTPACHDGDDATVPQTEAPYFKPSSPERTELFEEGMAAADRTGLASCSVAPASRSPAPC